MAFGDAGVRIVSRNFFNRATACHQRRLTGSLRAGDKRVAMSGNYQGRHL
jgi:hypothetical protein